MQAARGGDRAAFGLLVRRHRPWLVRLLAATVGDDDHAQDLAQEVFCRLYRSPESYEARDGRFVPWLKTVAVNAARNFLRDRKRRLRRAVPLPDAWEETVTDAEQGRKLDPEAVFASRQLAGEVRDALAALPDDQRQAVALHYFAGQGVEEVARALGVPPGTVKSRLFHARRRLREALEGHAAAADTHEKETPR